MARCLATPRNQHSGTRGWRDVHLPDSRRRQLPGMCKGSGWCGRAVPAGPSCHRPVILDTFHPRKIPRRKLLVCFAIGRDRCLPVHEPDRPAPGRYPTSGPGPDKARFSVCYRPVADASPEPPASETPDVFDRRSQWWSSRHHPGRRGPSLAGEMSRGHRLAGSMGGRVYLRRLHGPVESTPGS